MFNVKEWREDQKFAEQFKKERNEQFYVLVKMHLSFLLNVTTEEREVVKLRKWNLVPFCKKSKHKQQEGAFLNQDVLDQVRQLTSFLKTDTNLNAEGIFRRTGSLERQNELKNLLLQGCTINFDEHSFTVHDCASVLKGFLSELPEPLITDIQFPIYCQIAESFKFGLHLQELKILQSIQLLFLLLPEENKLLLQDLFELLHLVTRHESTNRMSSENLAKLFTPHLLCLRTLTPETLLKDSQSLFAIVAFMIREYPVLFQIPPQLMLDMRSQYERGCVLNESIKGAAHTVFSFVDNKLTAKENEENVTDSALAELYAHIQGLPESSKKRKLVKHFNKYNGQGTPLQVIRSTVPKNKSLGDSIKKHMFHKKLLKNVKRSGLTQLQSTSSEELVNSPHLNQKTSSKGRLFCHNHDSSTSDEDIPLKKLKSLEETPVRRARSSSDSDLSLGSFAGLSGKYLTSTPACILNRVSSTPEDQDRKSMSPITRSAQRMPRAMQETMMTPRSRKPVLLVSGTNINNLAKVSPTLTHLQEEEPQYETVDEEPQYETIEEQPQHDSCLTLDSTQGMSCMKSAKKMLFRTFIRSRSAGDMDGDQKHSKDAAPKLNQADSYESLTSTFRLYLNDRDMTPSPTDSMFSSRSEDFRSGSKIGDARYMTEACNEGKISDSMLYILDGNSPMSDHSTGEKKLVLKPRQYDENGKPIVFETSF